MHEATTEIYTLSLHDALPISVTYRVDVAENEQAVDAAIAVLIKAAKSISQRMYGTDTKAQ